jgi:hypothetical protein
MTRYKALPTKGDLGPEEALLQAANALDAAGMEAERRGDIEGMLNVGAMWMKLSEEIMSFSHAAEAAEEKEKTGELVKADSKIETGFQRGPSDEDVIIAEEEDNG